MGCTLHSAQVLALWGIVPKPSEPLPQPASLGPARALAAAGPELGEPALPRDIVEVYVLANGYAHFADERALPLAVTLASRGFGAEARVVRARFHAAAHQPEAALAELIPALDELRHGSIPLCDTALKALRMMPRLVRGKPALAKQALAAVMAGPLSAYQSEWLRIGTAQQIASGLDDPELCVRALGADLDQPSWEGPRLEARRDCLQRAAHPALPRAEADLRRFIGNTPGRIDDGLALPAKPELQSRATP